MATTTFICDACRAQLPTYLGTKGIRGLTAGADHPRYLLPIHEEGPVQ